MCSAHLSLLYWTFPWQPWHSRATFRRFCESDISDVRAYSLPCRPTLTLDILREPLVLSFKDFLHRYAEHTLSHQQVVSTSHLHFRLAVLYILQASDNNVPTLPANWFTPSIRVPKASETILHANYTYYARIWQLCHASDNTVTCPTCTSFTRHWKVPQCGSTHIATLFHPTDVTPHDSEFGSAQMSQHCCVPLLSALCFPHVSETSFLHVVINVYSTPLLTLFHATDMCYTHNRHSFALFQASDLVLSVLQTAVRTAPLIRLFSKPCASENTVARHWHVFRTPESHALCSSSNKFTSHWYASCTKLMVLFAHVYSTSLIIYRTLLHATARTYRRLRYCDTARYKACSCCHVMGMLLELISKSWIRPQQWSKQSYALRCQGRPAASLSLSLRCFVCST